MHTTSRGSRCAASARQQGLAVHTVLTECIRPHHRAASALLHGREQARYAAECVGGKGDDAELAGALGLKVLQDLGHPRAHEDDVVEVVCCCDQGHRHLA